MTKAWKLVGKAMSTVQSLGNNLHSLTGWQVVAGNQEVQLIANSTEKLSIALVALPYRCNLLWLVRNPVVSWQVCIFPLRYGQLWQSIRVQSNRKVCNAAPHKSLQPISSQISLFFSQQTAWLRPSFTELCVFFGSFSPPYTATWCNLRWIWRNCFHVISDIVE